MKAKLEFDLDDQDDRMAHLRCVKALDMSLALFKIHQMVFNDEITSEEMKERISNELFDHGIDLNELIN